MQRSFDLSYAAQRLRRDNCVDTPVLNRNGLTKSPVSTWPNRAKNRSSTRFAVNSARSLISAALAQIAECRIIDALLPVAGLSSPQS
jgi:hypothetical protein